MNQRWEVFFRFPEMCFFFFFTFTRALYWPSISKIHILGVVKYICKVPSENIVSIAMTFLKLFHMFCVFCGNYRRTFSLCEQVNILIASGLMEYRCSSAGCSVKYYTCSDLKPLQNSSAWDFSRSVLCWMFENIKPKNFDYVFRCFVNGT